MSDVALLGLATTRDLLDELAVRFEVTTPNRFARAQVADLKAELDEAELGYRPVDS